MRRAGFWIRFFAALVDGILLSILLGILQGVSGWHFTGIWDNRDNLIPHLVYTFMFPLLWNGYTPGKRLLSIRIVRMDGEPPGWVNMLLRVVVAELLYVITLGILYIVSAFMVALREDKRSIHDLLAGTQVVYRN